MRHGFQKLAILALALSVDSGSTPAGPEGGDAARSASRALARALSADVVARPFHRGVPGGSVRRGRDLPPIGEAAHRRRAATPLTPRAPGPPDPATGRGSRASLGQLESA